MSREAIKTDNQVTICDKNSHTWGIEHEEIKMFLPEVSFYCLAFMVLEGDMHFIEIESDHESHLAVNTEKWNYWSNKTY